jgi:membrane-bound lytic murein transglycosylase D
MTSITDAWLSKEEGYCPPLLLLLVYPVAQSTIHIQTACLLHQPMITKQVMIFRISLTSLTMVAMIEQMKPSLTKNWLSLCLSATLAACASSSSQQFNHTPTPTTNTHATLWHTIQKHQQLPHHTDNPLVQQQLAQYCQHSYQIQHTLQHALPIVATINTTIEASQLPSEITLIPYIESHYNARAYAKTGATGLWQMMPGTASGFGLTINWWVDQRKDILASTDAAVAYLKYLYHYFDNDWLLAIAAYDSGEGTVRSAIRRNQRQHKPTDFWSLHLPKETKHYIPKLLALAEVIQHPNDCHLELPITPYAPLKSVKIPAQLHFKQIAGMAASDVSTIATFNPQFNQHMTELNNPEQTLLLPLKQANILNDQLKVSKSSPIRWHHHEVKHNDTINTIAKRYDTTTASINKVNPLSNQTIQPGQHLLIPTGDLSQLNHHNPTPNNTSLKYQRGPVQHLHTIQQGDTLDQIARKNHVTTGMIRYWNPHDAKRPLTLGKRLVLWLPRKEDFDTYTVQYGDTLSTIAEHFSIRTLDIQIANGFSHSKIRTGQTLRIPMAKTKHHGHVVLQYIVQSGDSIYSIAKKHQLTMQQIMDWNQLDQTSIIHPKQSLTLYR